MLIEFKVANYRSVRGEQTLSMVASNYSDELSNNLISSDLPGMKATRLVKAVAVYGANASGKSNIIAALRFFGEFVCKAATLLQPGALTGAEPFKLDPACLKQPSAFEITAIINKIRTVYGLELTRERVTSEYLVVYPKGRPQVCFERDWDSAKASYEWSRSTDRFKHDAALRDKTRENATFVGTASQFAHKEATVFSEWITNRMVRMLEFGENLQSNLVSRIAIGSENIRKTLIQAATEADLGIGDALARKSEAQDVVRSVLQMQYNERIAKQLAESEVKKHSAGHSPIAETEWFKKNFGKVPGSFYTPELIHAGKDGTQIPLAFDDEESSGTRRYLELSAQLALGKSLGYLMVYDEIEAGLHPLLVSALLRRFLSASKSVAQIVFTTHNPLLLDQTLLRRDQIWFTEKDEEGATRLYPLTDYAPRKNESLVKGYLAGRYGGIPFIPESVKLGEQPKDARRQKATTNTKLKKHSKKKAT